MNTYGARQYAKPLAQVTFGGVQGTRRFIVLFQHADGSWEGEANPDQLVMPETLDLQAIHARLRRGIRRPTHQVGRIETRRGTVGGKPVLAGTRIPVATVQEYLEYGADIREILHAFPALTPADVEAVRAQPLAR